MSVVRRFLVASSLVRLIRKERGGARITEGYFAPQSGRISYVRVDGQTCHLVLVNTATDGSTTEERTDVPRAHGDALLDVCSGKAAYDRTVIALGAGREAFIDRYSAPGALDLVSVTFDAAEAAEAFAVPAWFAAEVTADPAYDRHMVAIQGVPPQGEIGLSNAGLDAVLDLVEPRFGFGRYGGASKPSETDGMMRALRRVAGAPVPVPVPVSEEPPHEPVQEEPAPAEAPPEEAHVAEPEPQPVHDAAHEPAAAVHAPQPDPVHAAAHSEPETAQHIDTRIDDVIESLSQALGHPLPPSREDDVAAEFERWTVRPRRTQQT